MSVARRPPGTGLVEGPPGERRGLRRRELAYDQRGQRVAPHIHVSVGLKAHSATGRTSHLLGARVQFLTELLIIEVRTPTMLRVPEPGMYDVPLLRIDPEV